MSYQPDKIICQRFHNIRLRKKIIVSSIRLPTTVGSRSIGNVSLSMGVTGLKIIGMHDSVCRALMPSKKVYKKYGAARSAHTKQKHT